MPEPHIPQPEQPRPADPDPTGADNGDGLVKLFKEIDEERCGERNGRRLMIVAHFLP